MEFRELSLAGAYVVAIDYARDERGAFGRTFDADEFAARGLDSAVAQCSVSVNRLAGTLRGLHFQVDPHAEAKLVRCSRGAIFDVIVDLRRESASHCRWEAVELTPENALTLYIPPGMAHGFQTLADDTEVTYQMNHPHEPAAASGVRWDDPAFAVTWPAPPAGRERLMSARDRAFPDYAA
ncbi:MAG: dTDP-4-dehydrorhamnose 3,5-epimerase [Solirubrobacteraceae bacterium]|jgi:dTDP-4-dehydrorhamnose 3,5-epimerase|nr:dTDP-4-dehydrorhamnose 3,5-epimerase [Solirubrobacteraceae bacterium]